MIIERSHNVCDRTGHLYERLERLRDKLRGLDQDGPTQNPIAPPNGGLVGVVETTQRYIDLCERMLTDIEEMF